MTMVDGWVVERISEDPAVLPLSGAAATTVEDPKSGRRKQDKKKRDKKRERRTDAKRQESVSEPAVADETPAPIFEPIVITPVAESVTSEKAKKDKKSRDAGDSKGGKVLTGCLAFCAIAAIGYFSFPYLASLLQPPEVAVFTAGPDEEPTQRYVIDGDTMYLEGSVPNSDVSDAIEGAAEGALGQDRVINNFEISADAVYDPRAPVQLTVAETVQFGTGRADIAEQYAPLIDLAVELMTSQPNVTLTIIGHTDDIGDEEENLRLSIERATATAGLIEDRGIAADRLTIDGRGESEPIDSNETPEGRQANRRVEFLVRGLLD